MGVELGVAVDGAGFHVEPEVLRRAADGMREIVADQDGSALADLSADPTPYGHDGVHASFAEFCASWSVGVDALCDRARRTGASLAQAAQAYLDADDAVARSLGTDPGMDAATPDVSPFGPAG